MAARKRGLGKGLDALLGERLSSELGAINGNEELRFLPVDLIQQGQFQPRMVFNEEALQDLANSIKAQGVVQPILVRPNGTGDKYEIIAGERRWRAAQMAGLHEIPVVLRQIDDQTAMCMALIENIQREDLNPLEKYEIIAGERRWRAAQMAGLHEIPVVLRQIDDQTAMCMALIENIQREDLNPLEQAQGLARLLDEFGMTHEGIADAVGRSRSTISNMLRLLDLNATVKEMLGAGKLEMGHARAILGLPEKDQVEAAAKVVRQSLSVRATETLVRQALSGTKKTRKKAGKKDPDTMRLETELSDRLGAAVNIKHSSKGKGVLQISYNSLDELDGILKHIK